MDKVSKPIAFITGINGFTGNYLSKYLSSLGWKVYGLSNQTMYNSFECLHANINEKDQIKVFLEEKKPDYIFHLAGISFVGHTPIKDFYEVNTIGTEQLLQAIVESKIEPKKVILASSATIYGTQNTNELSEELIPNPSNHYALSKFAMEQIAKNYFDILPIIITRPFNYSGFGHSENFVIPKIAKHFIEKKSEIELGNIDTLREYNDVRWVAEVYRTLAESNATDYVVNICSGQTHSIREIIKIFEAIFSHKIIVKQNPKFVRKNEIHELKGSTKILKSHCKIKSNEIEDLIRWMIAS